MYTLDQVLDKKIIGLYYGNRILLPFKTDILKAVVNGEIIMDFSSIGKIATYKVHDKYTEVYFHKAKNLFETMSKFETIKLAVAPYTSYILDTTQHRQISLKLIENHQCLIQELDDEIIFIE